MLRRVPFRSPDARPATVLALMIALAVSAETRRSLQVEVVARGLEVPWALAFAPDGRLFVTERPGRIRVVRDGRLDAVPLATLPVAALGEGGLMGNRDGRGTPAASDDRILWILNGRAGPPPSRAWR